MAYYFVYIMASKKGGVLYTGVTNSLARRIYEHKNGFVEGFTRKYNLKNLVYYEIFSDIDLAIKREKDIKGWNRSWKIKLIEKKNAEWKDLYNEVIL
jgi:putative endonuclease